MNSGLSLVKGFFWIQVLIELKLPTSLEHRLISESVQWLNRVIWNKSYVRWSRKINRSIIYIQALYMIQLAYSWLKDAIFDLNDKSRNVVIKDRSLVEAVEWSLQYPQKNHVSRNSQMQHRCSYHLRNCSPNYWTLSSKRLSLHRGLIDLVPLLLLLPYSPIPHRVDLSGNNI